MKLKALYAIFSLFLINPTFYTGGKWGFQIVSIIIWLISQIYWVEETGFEFRFISKVCAFKL